MGAQAGSTKAALLSDKFDQLTFRGIQIHVTSLGGPVTQMQIGIMGTMVSIGTLTGPWL